MAENLARTAPHWRKSTKSGNNNNCVEVATNVPGAVLVRDSKDAAGPALEFGPGDWRSLTSAVRSGRLG